MYLNKFDKLDNADYKSTRGHNVEDHKQHFHYRQGMNPQLRAEVCVAHP